MSDIEAILENADIKKWSEHFARHPRQANALHQSDAELVEIPGDDGRYLAVTIDTVAEEIAAGLYQDPYTMGWVTIMASASDLAAVGAEPIGILISVSLKPEDADGLRSGIAKGMEAACRALGTHILGGDTNQSAERSLTACSCGLVPKGKAMKRTGCRPGDVLFMTGRAGAGNALGFARLAGRPEANALEASYRPRARIAEGLVIRDRARCCMDTSDGVLHTLDQMMRLNAVGFSLDCDNGSAFPPEVLELCRRNRVPPWLMLAGPHGEFELVFTVPGERAEDMIGDPAFKSAGLTRLGSVKEKPELSLVDRRGAEFKVDMAPVRNLLASTAGDPGRYLEGMMSLARGWPVE